MFLSKHRMFKQFVPFPCACYARTTIGGLPDSVKNIVLATVLGMSFKLKEVHWETMISFMEEHNSLAVGRISAPNGRATMKELWRELSEKLNALKHGERSPEKWQKVSDLLKNHAMN